MKRIALIATLAVLSAGVALWFSQSYAAQWEPQLRALLEQKVGAALGARLRIGSISIPFLHRAALKNVELWDTRQQPEVLVFRAREIALTVSLFDIPRAIYHRSALESIGVITVDSPVATLSPESLNRYLPKKKSAAPPLWLTVQWNQGTFQWKDPASPLTARNLYRAEGYFRVRGPRMEAKARGSIDEAELIEARYSKFGRRWSAQLHVSHADIPKVLAFVERFTEKPLLPEGWSAQGRFNLDLVAGGRRPLSGIHSLKDALKDGNLELLDAQLHPGQTPSIPPVQFVGGIKIKGSRLDFSHLSIKAQTALFKCSGEAHPFAASPNLNIQAESAKVPLDLLLRYGTPQSPRPLPLHGTAAVAISVNGNISQPNVVIQANIPEAGIGRLLIQNAVVRLRRAQDHWEIESSSLRLRDGHVVLKGTLSLNQTDLQLTGEGVSLDAFGGALKGRLNFSLNSRGPLENIRTTGSFWINNFSWVRSYANTVRGDVDLAPTYFKLQGAAESGPLRLQADGTRTAKAWTLRQATLQLRESTNLILRGTYNPNTERLQGSMEGTNLSLADDIPQLQAKLPSLKGRINTRGTLEGTLQEPVFKADFDTTDLQISASAPSKAHLTVRWTPSSLNGEATTVLTDFPISEALLRFNLHDRGLDIPRFSLKFTQGKAEFKGQATWEPAKDGKPLQTITYRGDGKVMSAEDGKLWNAPCQFKGHVQPANQWSGDLLLTASKPLVNQRASDPLEAAFHWKPGELRWDAFHWGTSLQSQGAVLFKESQNQISGELKAQDIDLARWQGLIWPHIKEPAQGRLTGTFTLGGSLLDPVLKFSGKVRNGTWRAFHFETSVGAEWKQRRLEPLTLDATLASGGRIRFQGRLSLPDQMASGSLDATQVELKQISDSLSFPHPLEGKADGTFTVKGPLNQLHLAGHVEGGALTYSGETPHPLKLKSYLMDLKIEPAPEPNVTRFTITQALAKTQEEEVRIQPGSFVDFAGLTEARMQISTEIRNLHLGVFTLFGGLDINGTWQIRPQGFALQGDLFTRSLYINDYQLEQGYVQASYYHGVLLFEPPRQGPALLTGIVDIQNAPQLSFKDFTVVGKDGAGLRLTGQVGPQKWNFTMQGNQLDLSTLGGLAGFPYPLSGNANINIKGTGDLEHPNVEGRLEVRSGRAMGLDFQSGDATFAWQGQRMTFTRLQLSDPGRYTLTGAGVFPLAPKVPKGPQDKTIDFSVRLTDSNLGLLQSISKEVKSAKGSVQALVQIKGTTDAPKFRGSIQIKNGDVLGAHYVQHLEDFQFKADFDDNDLIISEFRGKSDKGSFTGGGHILFAGFKPKFYDLRIEVPSSKGIEVTVPELAIPESPLAKKLRFLTQSSQCDVKGQATFRGPAEAPVFFGQATLSKGHFTFPPSTKRPPPAGFLEWIRRVAWDVDLRFKDDAWFENELVEAELQGALAIKGTSQKLKVDGGMDIAGGKISYLGVEFDIRQARFEIHSTESESGIVTIPYVRGIAESHVQTVDSISGQATDDTITLTINYAPVNEIKPQLRSNLNPELTQDKLLARVTQLEMENLTPQERNSIYQQHMVRLLDTTLATPLARNLLKRTKLVDELRVSRVINPTASNPLVDPSNPSAGQQDPTTNLLAGTKYTVAKNLSSRLSLGYGVRFEQITSQDLTNKLDLRSDVEMSYRFLSNIYLRGSFDLPDQTPGYLPDRRVTIEPHWRFGWWGNTNKNKIKPKPAPSAPPAPPAEIKK